MPKIFSLKNSNEWSLKLKQLPLPRQDIYYLPEYYKIYENRGEGRAQCFLYENNGEIALYPFLQRKIQAISWIKNHDKEYYDIEGAYGYNGIVFSSDSKEFRDKFFKKFSQFCFDSNIIAEFSRFHPLIDNYLFSQGHVTTIFDRNTVYLDLSAPYETIWENYSKTNRNVIRKAQKIGIKIQTSTDLFYLKNFVKLYHDFLDFLQADKYYYFNIDYFLDLKKYINDHFYLFSALYEEKIIAQLLLLTYNQYAHVHLACRDHSAYKIPVNNLLYDYCIKFSKDLGCRYIHFGGGRSNSEDDSLYKFKKIFSKNESKFYLGKKIYNKEIYDKLCSAWHKKFPEKAAEFEFYFLKYWK